MLIVGPWGGDWRLSIRASREASRWLGGTGIMTDKVIQRNGLWSNPRQESRKQTEKEKKKKLTPPDGRLRNHAVDVRCDMGWGGL